MPSGLASAQGDSVLTLTAQGAGTLTSGPIAASGAAAYVLVMVHVSATSGTPTLNVSLEQADDAATWTALTGSSTAQLTAAGNAVAAAVPTKSYVRVTATVAGGTPSVTAKIAVLVFAE